MSLIQDAPLKDVKQQIISASLTTDEIVSTFKDVYFKLSQEKDIESRIIYIDIVSILIIKLTKASKDKLIPIDEEFFKCIHSSIDFSSKSPINANITLLVKRIITYVNLESVLLLWIEYMIDAFNGSKIELNLIELLAKSIKTNSVTFFENNQVFIHTLFEFFKYDGLANSSSKVLIANWSNIYQMDPDNWFKYWDEITYRHLLNPVYSKNIQTYLLPNLFKISGSSLLKFTTHFTQNQDETQLQLMMSVLRIGEDLKVDSSEVDFDLLICHQNISVRNNALSLLCYSGKSTKPILPEAFSIIRKNLYHLFIDSGTVDLRTDLVNTLNQFLIRIKHSGNRLANRKATDEYILFLRWFLGFLKQRLLPTSSYSEYLISLAVLEKLLDLDLDSLQKFPLLTIFDSSITRRLLGGIHSNYEDIREYSLAILFKCPADLALQLIREDSAQIEERALKLCTSLTSRHSDTGALFYQFLSKIYIDLHRTDDIYELCTSLITETEKAQSMTVDNLKVEYRVHGILQALRLILEILPDQLFNENISFWQVLSLDILRYVKNIWDIVKPIISNEHDDCVDDKVFTNFSWRFIKESTLLINTIFRLNSQEWKLQSPEQFLGYVSMLIDQLASIKHRGAFSSIYPSFVSTIGYCFTNEHIKKFPDNLLTDSLKLVHQKTQLISRRSAGLPSILTGILTSQKQNTGTCSSRVTFEYLLNIVREEVTSETNKYDLPQVNAMNCLKNIIIDAKLTKECEPHLTEVLKVCFHNFSSKNWSIRNCALMLFASTRSKLFNSNEKVLAKDIFQDYQLKEVLLEVLRSKESSNYFPALSILTNLNFLYDSEDLSLVMTELVNLLKHPSWKIREMVARALSSVILPTQGSQRIDMLVLLLDSGDTNLNHGIFLSILNIVTAHKITLEETDLFSRVHSWSALRVYIQLLDYITIPTETRYQLQLILVNNLKVGNEGLKRLVVVELLKYLLKTEKIAENVNDLIELSIDGCYDFKKAVLEFLETSKFKELNTKVLWKLLGEETDGHVKAGILRILSEYPPPSDLSFSNEVTKDAETRAIVVHLQSSVNLNPDDIVTEGSYDQQFHYLSSIMTYFSRQLIDRQNKQQVELLLKTVSFLLSDERNIRSLASGFLSKMLKFEHAKPPYETLKYLGDFLLDNFDHKITEDVAVSQTVNFSPPSSLLLRIYDERSDEALFDSYDEELYEKDSITLQTLYDILSKLNLWKPHQEAIASTIGTECQSIIKFLETHGIDGLLGYTQNRLVFRALYNCFWAVSYFSADQLVPRHNQLLAYKHQLLTLSETLLVHQELVQLLK